MPTPLTILRTILLSIALSIAPNALAAPGDSSTTPFLVPVEADRPNEVQLIPTGNSVNAPGGPAFHIEIVPADTSFEIKTVNHIGSSMFTVWAADGGLGKYKVSFPANIPASQWYGKFKGTLSKTAGVGAGAGQGQGGKEIIKPFEALVTGDSSGTFEIMDDEEIVCKSDTNVTFTAAVRQPDNTLAPAPAGWAVDWHLNPGMQQVQNGINPYPIQVAGHLSDGSYTVHAQLADCTNTNEQGQTTSPVTAQAALHVVDLHAIQVAGQSTTPIVVCAGESLSLTAISTSTLTGTSNLFPANLPTWQSTLTGTSTDAGVAFAPTNGKTVTATFPANLAGQTITITANACGTTKSIEVTVIRTDIDPPNYVHDTSIDNERTTPPGNEEELNPGGWLVLNDDHELNTSNWDLAVSADKSANTRVLPLSAVAAPNSAGTSAQLKWDATRVAIYQGTAPIPLTSPATLSPSSLTSLFIEGIKPSGSMGDVNMTLIYPTSGVATCMDEITMTVLRVDLDVDSDNSGAIDADEHNGGSASATEDANETDKRHIFCANYDDDDSDGTRDNEDTIVNGSADFDDMTDVVIRRILPNDAPLGTIKLSGADNVRIFNPTTGDLVKPAAGDIDGSGTALETADLWLLLAGGDLTLKAEGVSPGDAELTVTYVSDSSVANGAITLTDKVALKVIEFDLDIDINGDGTFADTEDDPLELGPTGLMLCLNNDDDGAPSGADNANDIIDGTNDGADLKTIKLRHVTAGLPAGGTLKLEVADQSKVRIFDSSGTAVLGPSPLNASHTISVASVNAGDVNFQVEGVEPGTTTVTATYQFGSITCTDTVLISVTGINAVLCKPSGTEVTETDEESPGILIAKNDDYDSGGANPDHDDAVIGGTVAQITEDKKDMAKLVLKKLPVITYPAGMRVTLDVPGDLRVFRGDTNAEITSTDNLYSAVVNADLVCWVEGDEVTYPNIATIEVKLETGPSDTTYDLECSDKVGLRVMNINIIGHKPGTEAAFGTAISEKNEIDPTKLIACVNEDYDDDPAARDNFDATYKSTTDNDLVGLKLQATYALVEGRVEFALTTSNGNSARVFDTAGNTPLNDTFVDYASPSGDLVQVYLFGEKRLLVEGMDVDKEVVAKMTYKDADGDVVKVDEVKFAVVRTDLIGPVNDPIEDKGAGAIVNVNNDDDGAPAGADNGNAVIDGAEDRKDLLSINLRKAVQAGFTGGTITLQASDYSKIRVFDDGATGDPAILAPTATTGYLVPLANVTADRALLVEAVDDGSVKLSLIFKDNDGTEICRDDLRLTNIGARLKELEFSGTKYHELTNDEATITYNAPHWRDLNGDGDTTDAMERNFSVAFTRNTKQKLAGKISFAGSLGTHTAKLRADGPGNVDFPITNLTLASGVLTFAATNMANDLHDSVQHFNRSGAAPFELSWKIKIGDSQWMDLAKTKHTVYVTLKDPTTAMRQETLFNIGSRNAATSTTDAQVVTGVWSEFADRVVSRVTAITSNADRDPTGMIYWHPGGNACVTVAKLLEDGNASCGTWAPFFQECLKAQGVGGHRGVTVDAPNPANPVNAATEYAAQYGVTTPVYYFVTGANTNAPPAAALPVGARVLQFDSNNGGVSKGVFYVNTVAFATDFVNLPAMNGGFPGGMSAAQGNANARAWFGNHAIVEDTAASVYYDPSYGGASHANHVDWEDLSLHSYGGLITVFEKRAAGLVVHSRRLWIEQLDPAGTAETTFTP